MTLFAERFELETEVGAGGMGTVWRAKDTHTGDPVALKILKGSEIIDFARFAREAKVLQTLEHPNIVRYVGHDGQTEDAWLAMEWLDGETLADRLVRGAMSASEAVGMTRQIASALAFSHGRGIVHRDLKPANLFLCSDGSTVKVLDFGIARAVFGGSTLTMTGTTIGTPHYMSPEQARAEKGVEPSSDVYALGCVLYESLTGVRPFDGETAMAVLAKILLEDPRPLVEQAPDVPVNLERLVRRMLEKDRSRRPGNGALLLEELDALGDVGPSSPRPSLAPKLGTSEQRLVCVVMVADVGFHGATAATVEQTDASVGLHDELRELARVHGGRVEIMANGSMVATVGGRGVATDQAGRAARLALALRALLPDAPIAVVAGRTVITARLPAGGVVDRGVAALSDGQGARVRIDDVVDGLLDERFVREGDSGSRWLCALRSSGPARRTFLGKRVPCIGRRRELATLNAIAEESIEEPVARAVLIRAPAGGGKSRLVQEWLETSEETVSLLFARSDPMRAKSPYAALASAIRMAAGIAEGEPVEEQRAKLARRVDEVAEGADRERLSWFLAELVRAPFEGDGLPSLEAARRDPQLMGDAVRGALEDWMALECKRRPVVLVLEDIHTADRPSVEAIDALLRHLEEQPFLVVATARPEIDDAFPNLWQERDVQELQLARLTRRSASKLVKSVLGDADQSLIDQIVSRGDGNAFFLEELIRAYVRDEDVSVMPDTVLGMVEARLANLDAGGRRVLRAASVFGARFWTEAVQHLVGPARVGHPGAQHWLAAFADDELIQRQDESSLLGQDEWRFRNALVRDAAYAMLTDEDRELGHRLSAKWLENHGVRDPRVLADHLRLGGQPTEAAALYLDAAAQALDANDYDAVLANVALGAEGDLPPWRIGELSVLEAEAHRWRGNYEGAAEAATRAVGYLPVGEPRWFQAVGNAIVALGMRGRHDEVERLGDRAMDAEGKTERLICLCRAAHHALGRSDMKRAETIIAKVDAIARTILRDHVDAPTEAWLHTTHAALALHAGAITEYLEGTAAAVRAYDAAGDRRHACNQRVRLGYGFVEVGELARAEEALRVAQADAQRLHIELIEGFALQNLGWVRALQSETDDAVLLERRALELGERLSAPALEGGARFYLSRIAYEKGDWEQAAKEAELATGIVETIPPLRTLCVAAHARACLAMANTAKGSMLAGEAVDALGTLDAMPETKMLVWLAWLETGDRDEELRARAQADLDARLEGMSAEHRASFIAGPEASALRRLLD